MAGCSMHPEDLRISRSYQEANRELSGLSDTRQLWSGFQNLLGRGGGKGQGEELLLGLLEL